MKNQATNRGEIYWIEDPGAVGSEQSGSRPVLVVQNDIGNRTSPTTIVVFITSQQRRQSYPFHVYFNPEESGLRVGGVVLCERIRTVDQSRLKRRMGGLNRERMRQVDLALHHSLGLEH